MRTLCNANSTPLDTTLLALTRGLASSLFSPCTTDGSQNETKNMLSQRSALRLPAALRAGCSHHIPASTVALSRIARTRQTEGKTRFLTTAAGSNNEFTQSRRYGLSTQPICNHIDSSVAHDLSSEDFDSKFG